MVKRADKIDFLNASKESWFDVPGFSGGDNKFGDKKQTSKSRRQSQAGALDEHRKRRGEYPAKISLAPVRLKEVKGDGQ